MLTEKQENTIKRLMEIENIEERLSYLVNYHKSRVRKINNIISDGKKKY